MFRYIKKLGFDIDGTLYERNGEMDNRIQLKVAEKLLQIKPELECLEGALAFFKNEYEKKFKGGRTILREAGYTESSKVMDECLTTADIMDLIKPDTKLTNLMLDLSKLYSLFIVTSNPRNLAIAKLERLGLKENTFEFLVCSEDGDKRKGIAFNYALRQSRLPAINHLYIGDSPGSDIEPARTMGMHTILVNPSIPDKLPGVVKKIYDIRGLLL